MFNNFLRLVIAFESMAESAKEILKTQEAIRKDQKESFDKHSLRVEESFKKQKDQPNPEETVEKVMKMMTENLNLGNIFKPQGNGDSDGK